MGFGGGGRWGPQKRKSKQDPLQHNTYKKPSSEISNEFLKCHSTCYNRSEKPDQLPPQATKVIMNTKSRQFSPSNSVLSLKKKANRNLNSYFRK